MVAQSAHGSLKVNRVPQHDGRRHQVEATGAVALLLKTTITYFAQAVEEHRSGQRVASLANGL